MFCSEEKKSVQKEFCPKKICQKNICLKQKKLSKTKQKIGWKKMLCTKCGVQKNFGPKQKGLVPKYILGPNFLLGVWVRIISN